ncbi:hypothetical protein J6590_083887 [Homalodisca vitripennis]|nr:hypothetical protein J6590_083887 [Homalodisca vitripennis]
MPRGDAIMKEVNVPSNKIPKSLNSVNREVHLVVSSMMKTSKQIDRTKDFWTVDQPVQNSIEEENILSYTPENKRTQSEQSSYVIERTIVVSKPKFQSNQMKESPLDTVHVVNKVLLMK